MKRITDNIVLRNEMTRVLNFIDCFCREHEIEYSLIYGSLIGAFRHQGIIPWDDDIDIAMTRENYEKFRLLFKETEDFCFYDDRSCKKWFIPFCGCVRSKRFASYDDQTKSIDSILSLRVDIYPFDFVGDTDEEAKNSFKIVQKYIKKMGFMVLNKRYATLRMNKKHSYFWNLLFFLPRFLKFEFKKMFWPLQKKAIKKITKPYLNKMPTKYVACLWDLDNKINYFDNFFTGGFKLTKFENYLFPTISNYDYFLTKAYGDWRTPPKDSERNPYHLGNVVYLDDEEMELYYEKSN